MVFEFMPKGSLDTLLRNEAPSIKTEDLVFMMRDITAGMSYLHSEHIIHRDLAARNILLSESNEVKICDFGFSKVIKDPTVANKTCVGSPIYMAPQILDKKDYSAKCDIWSLGIIMY